MASSGYINGTTNAAGVECRIAWQQTINGANTSSVKMVFYVRNTSSIGYSEEGIWNLTLDGTTTQVRKEITFPANQTAWTKVGEATKTVTHAADGTKSVAMSVTGGHRWTGYTATTCTGTASLDPTSAPTPSTATCTASVAVNGTNKCSVTITRANSAYRHNVRWYINGTYTYTQTNVATSAAYAIPTSWLAAMPTATSMTAHVRVATYPGDTTQTQSIGYVDLDFTITVPASVKPTVTSGWYSLSPVQASGVPSGLASRYIKGYSKAQATFDSTKVTAPTGTTIAGYSMTYAGTAYGSPYTTPIINTAGDVTVTLTVTDGRGRTATATQTVTVYDYSAPTMSAIIATRTNSGGTASATGTYIKVQATANVSSVGGANTGTLTVRVKPNGGSYGSATTLTSGTAMVLSGFDASTAYTVQFTLTDTMGNSTTVTKTVAAGTAPSSGPSLLGFNIKEGGLAAAFGKKAETDGWLETNFTNGFNIAQGVLKMGNTSMTEAQLANLLRLLTFTAYGEFTPTANTNVTLSRCYYMVGGGMVIVRMTVTNDSNLGNPVLTTDVGGIPIITGVQRRVGIITQAGANSGTVQITTGGNFQVVDTLAAGRHAMLMIYPLIICNTNLPY